jgi:BON domain-containing protein
MPLTGVPCGGENQIDMRLLSLTVVLILLVTPLVAQKNPPTDDEISDQVLVKLSSDAELGGIKFDITVHHGEVTLKGKVRNDKQKIKAEKVTKKVKGVTSVVNQLVISPLDARLPNRDREGVPMGLLAYQS